MSAELQPLVDLAANDNIAISTLSTVLWLFAGAIIVLFGTLVLVIKWALAVNKEAWGHVQKFSEMFKQFSESVTYALGRSDEAGDRADQSSRRRRTD